MSTKRLLLLSGLPASGKSTLARKLVKDSGFQKGRINRDDLRAMLFDSNWSHKREPVIVECEKAIAKVLLNNDLEPIIDDTNFAKNEKMWEEYAFSVHAGFEKQFLDVPMEECIRRDAERKAKGFPSVGRNVIERFAAKNGLVDWGTRPVVLVDVDGTIANNNDREKLLHGGEKKNWDAYYSKLSEDTAYPVIFRWVKELEKDCTICLVSGRPDKYLDETLKWIDTVTKPRPMFPELESPRFRIDHTYFRNSGDFRPDEQIKPEILSFIPKSQILMVLDDRPRVLRAWKAAGLKNVIPVRGGIEEF